MSTMRQTPPPPPYQAPPSKSFAYGVLGFTVGCFLWFAAHSIAPEWFTIVKWKTEMCEKSVPRVPQTMRIGLRVNDTLTTVGCIITGTATNCSDMANTARIQAGDLVSLEVETWNE